MEEPKKAKGKKKRKADEPEAERVPPKEKKAKSSSVEHDERWQKYVKLQNAPANKKKETAIASVVKKEAKPKKKKKSNPLLKHREPCDLMRNNERAEQLNKQIEVIENISEENHLQKPLAIHVMAARERQTAVTLAIGGDKGNHIVHNNVDFCMEMKRLNYERTANNLNGEHVHALQDLMGDHGFFSINNEHSEQVLACINKDLRSDIIWAKKSQAETRNKLITSKKGSGPVGDTSNKKLNFIAGGIFYALGYRSRTPQLRYAKMKSQDEEDRRRRFEEYYMYDQLETETDYGELAENFTMFRSFKKELGRKYEQRGEIMKHSAALTPKADLVICTREYIDSFHYQPSESDELCANREQCVFKMASVDENVQYIGKVFYTEEETGMLARGEEIVHGNTHRLCYQCLILKYTVEWNVNCQRDHIPERPINYFTVLCKKGQYAVDCMLSVTENDKPTGIVGYLPRFSMNNLAITSDERHIKKDGKFCQVTVPRLKEVGMDF